MTSRSLTAAIVALQVCLSGSALASNDNFRLTNMREYNPNEDQALYLFRTFSRELGTALSYRHTFPADSTGLYGLDISIEANNAYINTDRGCPTPEQLGSDEEGRALLTTCYDDANNNNSYEWDPWRVMDTDHRLSGGKLYPVPGIRVRKGLPLSLEAGTALYILPFSSQAALQGFGRWSIHEGFETGLLRLIPDAALSMSITRLVGNPEFDLGVLDWGMTFGYTVPVGGVARSRIGDFSFFGSFGRSIITAVPAEGLGHIDNSPEDTLPDPLQCLSGWTGRQANAEEWIKNDSSGCEGRAVEYDRNFRPLNASLGISVHNGPFQMGWSMAMVQKDPESRSFRLGPPSMSFKVGLLF